MATGLAMASHQEETERYINKKKISRKDSHCFVPNIFIDDEVNEKQST